MAAKLLIPFPGFTLLGLRSRATLGVRVLNPKVGSLGAQDMTSLSPKVSEGRLFLKEGVSCIRGRPVRPEGIGRGVG